MKKIVPVMALSLALVGCNNSNAPANELEQKQEQEIQTNENEDSTQVIDVKKAADNKENNEEQSQEEPAEIEDEKDKEEVEEVEDEDKSKEDEKEDEEDKSSSKQVSREDLFFNPLGPFSRVNENGLLVDQNGNEITGVDEDHYDYVKYTNNIFVKSKNDIYDQVSIVRMNDKGVETLFEFPGVDDFRPLGMVGDRIYGFHNKQSKAEINGTPSLDTESSAIGYVDLATGEVHDFDATADTITGGAVVVDGELQFTKPGDNEQDAYNYDLYKLDLSKGDDQEAELVEKDFNLQYLFGQKRFENGNPVWKIYRADNDHLYANGQEFPFLWAEEGMQEIIGNNIFYYEASDSEDKLSRPIKVINMTSGETVLDTQIRGMKIADGKLYYLTTDNELESVDIEL